ncbi:hypothetical protein OKA04_15015 [Luteolibacter flavescens]|uniref:Uncharacterized protein n=1 Tax=Luteolibacter flavescens TaxID=1859460 RepID=A0ABT3FR35_9BACT|nr:hypothetical protein [Luteolibacter flavescens]
MNLSLLSGLLICIGGLVTRTSDTVKDSAGKLAAAEKSESIRRLLAADLAALPATSEGALECSSSADAWSLDLRLPSREGGWKDVRYRWKQEKGTLVRSLREGRETTSNVVGTGFSSISSHWLKRAAQDREDAPQSWSRAEAPALLHLELATSRLREEGRRDRLEKSRGETSDFRFLMPVGGGPAER